MPVDYVEGHKRFDAFHRERKYINTVGKVLNVTTALGPRCDENYYAKVRLNDAEVWYYFFDDLTVIERDGKAVKQ
jgi:hypothetical protein